MKDESRKKLWWWLGLTLVLILLVFSAVFLLGDKYQSPSEKPANVAADKERQHQENLERVITGLFRISTVPTLPSEELKAKAISPAGDKIAYLFPGEWETVSDIYLAKVKPGASLEVNQRELPAEWSKLSLDQGAFQDLRDTSSGQPSDSFTPKQKLVWQDNDHLLVIIGYTYGTVSPGGDVVRVDVNTGQAEMVYAAHEKGRQQVTDMELKDGRLYLTIITFDENMLNSQNQVVELPM